MWRGLYTAASGMITEMKRTDTLANNLANANTAGFKRDEAINMEFEPMLIKRINDGTDRNDITSFKGFHVGDNLPTVGTLGLGSYIDEIATDHSQGGFQTTGNPLDLGISGDGYFAVDTPQGVRYTRNGSFFRSSTGELQTVNGQRVRGQGGNAINIPENAINLNVTAQGEKVTVTITGHSHSDVYDASSHTVSGYETSVSNSLYTADMYTKPAQNAAAAGGAGGFQYQCGVGNGGSYK